MMCSTAKWAVRQAQYKSNTAQYNLPRMQFEMELAIKYVGMKITYDGVTVGGSPVRLKHLI